MSPPPGYVAFGGPGAAMSGNFQRIGSLTTAAVALQIAAIVMALVALVSQVRLAGKANDFLDNVITEREFEDSLGGFTVVTLLAGAIGIALLVVTIIWSFRIATNLTAAGRQLTWKPGLTIVAWILGGCTLQIITFLMLREHWKASDPDVLPGDQSWKTRPVPPTITAWFVLVLVGVAVTLIGTGRLISQGFQIDEDNDDVARGLADQLTANLVGGLLSAAAGVALVVVIRQLAARHMRLTREA